MQVNNNINNNNNNNTELHNVREEVIVFPETKRIQQTQIPNFFLSSH
jgi:hypothetical protein